MNSKDYRLGDKIYLQDYTEYIDYRDHEGEPAIIIELNGDLDCPITIQWKDRTTSCINEENILLKHKQVRIDEI